MTSAPPDWRPIESAPRDGTELLGFVPSYFQGKGGVRVIMWMRAHRTPDGAWYDGAAWTCEPTLWKPLDGPPGTERAAGLAEGLARAAEIARRFDWTIPRYGVPEDIAEAILSASPHLKEDHHGNEE